MRSLSRRRAYSLLELLAVVAVVVLLVAIMLPGLRGARDAARTTRCMTNLRGLTTAWATYGNEYNDRAMPLAYWTVQDVGSGAAIYWFGSFSQGQSAVDESVGFIMPYLDATLADRSVFECPQQPWGTYKSQGPFDAFTTTYGYNGYYLAPSKTPGWNDAIKGRPWRRLSDIRQPTELFVFADTLLPLFEPKNTAFLDPPMFFTSSGWTKNLFPTTAFRHQRGAPGTGTASTARADGSVRPQRAGPGDIIKPKHAVGSTGQEPDPHYVPDWRDW